MIIPTTLVGSYPQPDWLVDRATLGSKVPRIRAPEIWRVDAAFLEQAQDDATVLAIRDMELAGIDIVTDGEMRRESYSNRFATALEGVDVDHPGHIVNRVGARSVVPRIVGPIRRRHAVEVEDVKFLRAHTSKVIKITVPGPFTMSGRRPGTRPGPPPPRRSAARGR
jgi:5-methyltetrahydropteroyltriglutamate--homocysteine methyltransferase